MKTALLPRLIISSLFAGNGLFFGFWAVHIPLVQARFQLDPAQLGLLLLLIAGGSAGTLVTSGKTLDWFGSRTLLILGSVLMFCMLPVMLGAPNLLVLGIALLLYGIANGLMDVAMNEQGIRLEQRILSDGGKPILSGLHGAFSLGGLGGASFGAISLKLGSNGLPASLIMAAVGLGVVVFGRHYLLQARHEHHETKGSWRISRKLVLVSGMAFLVFLSEGAIADWSSVYLEKAIGVTTSRAAWGYAAFSMAMAVGRFSGDWIRMRVLPHDILTFCGAIAAVGMSMVLWKGGESLTLAGFALVGMGFSNIAPILFGESRHLPDTSAAMGLSIIVSCGYIGFLSGPVLIGFLIKHTGLTLALSVIALCAATVAIASSMALAHKD
ncbi:MFS transporter [Leeia oryzae]|uniref:MFS transporter n=1 Tax=Leeia oryzae TaxID=356662 RepID=UPI000377FC1B|nr:MFS transporter [Leeia oryzae]